jgi:hypothetical protein
MKRLKKILKWTAVILGALAAVLLIVNAWFTWTTDARLERQLAALREAGEPLTLADLARKPIPSEKNAATYLRKAEADAHEIADKPEYDAFWRYHEFPMPPEVRRLVRERLNAYPRLILLLEQAADCPDYDAQLDCTAGYGRYIAALLTIAQEFRNSSRMLHARAMLLVAEGDRDGAVRTSISLLRLARHFRRNPTVVAWLVAMTVQDFAIESANAALQTGTVSKEVRQALDAELAIEDRVGGYIWAIKCERVAGLELFGDIPSRRFWLLSRALYNRWESQCLDEWRASLNMSRDQRPYRDSIQLLHQVQAKMSPTERTLAEKYSSGLVGPSNDAFHTCVVYVRVKSRCLRVLNALQTRLTTGATELPKLTELGLPAEAITDPFTGEPLHVKRTTHGLLVYSVGLDYQDDGGKLDGGDDVGLGPPPITAKARRK